METPTLDQFEAVIHSLGTGVAALPPHTSEGRQKDRGANLKYTGYVLLFQYEDPAVPGKVYTATPSEYHKVNIQDARFQASENLFIVNGVVMRRQGAAVGLLGNLLDHFGEARPVLAVLAFFGKLNPILAALSPVVSTVAGVDPAGLLRQFLGGRRQVPGQAAVRAIEG